MGRGITWSNELTNVLGEPDNNNDSNDNGDDAPVVEGMLLPEGQESMSMHMSDASFFNSSGIGNNNGGLGSFLK